MKKRAAANFWSHLKFSSMNLFSVRYRKKNVYLAATCVLMALLSYLLAIRRTLAIRQSVIEMETMAAGENDVKSLEARLVTLGVGFNSGGGDRQTEQLMENVSNLCQQKGVRLHSFPSPEITQFGGLDVATAKFVVGGGYRKLLELLFELEKKQGTGKASSIALASASGPAGEKSAIELTVFWQNIRKQ